MHILLRRLGGIVGMGQRLPTYKVFLSASWAIALHVRLRVWHVDV
jgi:hypothetical protein